MQGTTATVRDVYVKSKQVYVIRVDKKPAATTNKNYAPLDSMITAFGVEDVNLEGYERNNVQK